MLSTRNITILLCLGCLQLYACAPVTQRPALDPQAVQREQEIQQELALEDYVKGLSRLNRVSWPILKSAVPLCKDDTRWAIGAQFASKGDFPAERRAAAQKLYGIGDSVTTFLVTEGSPAASAGLQPRDAILALNDKPMTATGGSTRGFVESLEKALQDGAGVSLRVSRNASEETVHIRPERVCKYPVGLAEDDSINAFADGNMIAVTTGMMRFAQDDTELALVIGHELAHNAMDHMDARMVNYGIGLLIDILIAAAGVNTQGMFSRIGAMAFSQEFEAEADYVGLYMLALSNVDIESAPNFWRRMAVAHPGAIQRNAFQATHPATPERFVQLEETVKEIRQKQETGIALMPETKSFKPSGETPANQPSTGFSLN